jgi:hypothetical protein
MHPDIQKFWEEIGEVDLTLSAPIVYWVVQMRHDGKLFQQFVIAEEWNGGPQDGPEQPTKYRYDEEWYSEEEMLRLIKIKAFL